MLPKFPEETGITKNKNQQHKIDELSEVVEFLWGQFKDLTIIFYYSIYFM